MLNEVNLIGNLGKDPVVNTTPNGSKVANFSLVTTETYKDKNTGERKEIPEWHQVVIWGALAEIVEKYLKKGAKVFIKGKNKTRKWKDKNGIERYNTEIVVQGFDCTMKMLGGGGGNNQPAAQGNDNMGIPEDGIDHNLVPEDIPF